MIGWHHQLNGHGFKQTLGVGNGQGGLACCSPWGHKELDMKQWGGFKLGKECIKAVYCHPVYLTH